MFGFWCFLRQVFLIKIKLTITIFSKLVLIEFFTVHLQFLKGTRQSASPRRTLGTSLDACFALGGATLCHLNSETQILSGRVSVGLPRNADPYYCCVFSRALGEFEIDIRTA